MRFQALQVSAFRRIRSPYTIPLDRQGLVFVQGENRDWEGAAESNAASKSLAIRETFLWGLYGKMSRHGEANVTIEACHPKHGAHVRVIGDRYLFDRSRDSAGGTPRFVILDPTTGLPAQIARDPTRKVDDTTAALGFDYRAACAALVLSDDGAPFVGARFADQMETLESVLRLEEFSRAALLAGAAATSFERAVAPLQAKVSLLGTQHTSAQADLARTAAQPLERLVAAMAVERKAADANAKLADLHPKIEREAKATLAAWHKADYQVDQVAGKARTFREDIRDTERALKSRRCSACGQPVKVNAAPLLKALKDAQANLATAEKRLTVLTVQREAAQVAMSQADALLEPARKARRIYDLALGAIEILQREHAEYTERIREGTARIQDLEQQVKAATTELQAYQARLWRALWWQKGFGRDGLQATYFAAAGPILNEAAARVSARLTNNNITVEFQPIRSTRLEDVIRLGGTSAPTVKGLSKGEKRRVLVIVAFALRALARWRNPVIANVMIFDEIFDGLDGAGLRGAAELLQEEQADGTSVFLVTHDDTLKRYFPATRTITVIRVGGESTVEVG